MELKKRIENRRIQSCIATPEEAAGIIKTGTTIAVSGLTSAGYPKVIPSELVKRKGRGEELNLSVISGANVGPEIDEDMAKAGIINRRIPFQASKVLGDLINKREVNYVEVPLNKISRTIQNNVLDEIDVAIIEAIYITKEGYIVPSTSVGLTPVLLNAAKQVIVEINLSQPLELMGIHDIYLSSPPPYKKPLFITSTNQRIGEPFIKINPDLIKFVVQSEIPDVAPVFNEEDEVTRLISDNLMNFLELEIQSRRLPKLLPIQSGLGNLANSLVKAFEKTNFQDIEFYCGVLQEANFILIEKGKVKAASGGGITPSERVLNFVRREANYLKKIAVLRPLDISNSGEIVNRLGVISLGNAIEVDIYGNANTSHVMGSKVVNGIGGGGGFAHNSYLSIMLLPSQAKKGAISSIVPMVTHCDINEHEIDVIITENGLADLRGKDPVERAKAIIENCASPLYKEQLTAYLNKSIKLAGGHQPQLLDEAFSWHIRLREKGSMIE